MKKDQKFSEYKNGYKPFERLDSFKELGHNWDDEGAPPVSDITVNTAKEMVRELWKYEPWVVPTPCGGIQLEFRLNGCDCELMIFAEDLMKQPTPCTNIMCPQCEEKTWHYQHILSETMRHLTCKNCNNEMFLKIKNKD
jgi:hypothetical protein